jgi:hypothetical protein
MMPPSLNNEAWSHGQNYRGLAILNGMSAKLLIIPAPPDAAPPKPPMPACSSPAASDRRRAGIVRQRDAADDEVQLAPAQVVEEGAVQHPPETAAAELGR